MLTLRNSRLLKLEARGGALAVHVGIFANRPLGELRRRGRLTNSSVQDYRHPAVSADVRGRAFQEKDAPNVRGPFQQTTLF